jgi:chemotaxis protein CheD
VTTARLENYFCYPAEVFVSDKPREIQTILGSCVALCLFNKRLSIGGLNHYLLPVWEGQGLASPKYGNVAIERLVEKMLKTSDKADITAKIFGGANLMNLQENVYRIGERNISIAEEILASYKIPITGRSVGGSYGRKILFNSSTGEVLVKYLKGTARNLEQKNNQT